MKKIIFLSFIFPILLFISLLSKAQVLRPIKWESKTSVSEAKVGETVELIFTAKIDEGWYLYSNDFDPDLGPMLTTFEFTPSDAYQLVGKKPTPVGAKKKFDKEIWNGEYTYFTKTAEFRQKVKILKPNFKVQTTANYQVCSDESGKCIPLEDDFTFDKMKVTAATDVKNEENKTEKITENATKENAENTDTQDNKTEETTNPNIVKVKADSALDNKELTKNKEQETPNYQPETINQKQNTGSLLGFMLAAFLSGLAALVTPCVFPMIPMTVSFFTKREKSRAAGISKALFFGASIVGIYVLIGVLFASIFGADSANLLATHWLPNVFFFSVFILFALSFFGMFEITLPSSLSTTLDAKAEKGGYIGAFFMALTLAVVSFSCTGPIVGTVLVEAAGGQFVKPVLGMVAFSSAFAIPFTLFAIFPSWLQSLPKSGGWLNSVKVVLGFVELALAFKFLSVADQVYHWGLLDRHVYIAIWTAISFCLGLYFLGKIQLPHDSPTTKVSVPRLLLAIATFTFTTYLFTGMFGAPLKALAGYLPPQSTLDFDLTSTKSVTSIAKTSSKKVKYGDILHLPHGLEGYFDLKEGLQAAKEANKPVFIDFTGHGCVNCREMEANVWSAPEVLKRLQEDYIVIALYTDEPLELPENEWITAKNGKVKKTMGKINLNYQEERFGVNSQPFYLLLDHNEQLLASPKDYDLKVENFVNFLDSGLNEFKKRTKQEITMK
jgi:thiol:disulfide interchange protein